MNELAYAFFAVATILIVAGGITTVAARNPIRGAMGLLATIVGIAGHYLLLSAEFLAAVQILVYAGAVVVLFLFVIMLLGPSATTTSDSRDAFARYLGAGGFLVSAIGGVFLLAKTFPLFGGASGGSAFPPAPKSLGTIEAVGHELFTKDLISFELSGALLVVAIVGAVAVARGRHVDPTLAPAPLGPQDSPPAPAADEEGSADPSAHEAENLALKESHR